MTFLRIWVVGVLALLSFSGAEGKSFVSGGTVVILVGLPGDMESEKTYGDETIRLLHLLNRPEFAPQKVVLLSSVPPSVDLKWGFPLEVVPNGRDSFLALVDKLKEAPAPAVFIAFGHGGNQGRTPVFHVPGPRLTPDDFATVAATKAASTWLLFFPGCGNFAKALQAPGRTLLATEAGDKVFTEDPISFGIFLNALETEGDLNRLSTIWGGATKNWYDSRQLARTEDPAIWFEMQQPVKLAVSPKTAADAIAADPQSTTNSLAAMPPTPTPAPAAPPGDAWSSIVPVDPAKYPQSNAITLSRSVSYILDDKNGVTEDEETFLQVLTPAGKRYGDFQFAFAPPNEDLNFLACEVRRTNGQIDRLDPDEIRDAEKANPDDYDVERRKLVSFPAIEPGAIIHIHLQRQWLHFPMPHVFQEVQLANENPTVNLKVEIRLPSTEAFHFKLLRQPTTDPMVSKTEYGSLYSWQFHDLPAVLEEPLSPPEQAPALVITTFPDWAAFSDWYIRLIRDSNKPEPELTAQAQALIVGAKDDEDKIERVTRFVTNFRYVSVPLGVNSFRPHSALHVWQNRYGDCKDKANLLATLLTAVGFKTHLVLVPRFSQAYADLPGFAFNHAIAAVDLPGKTLWIDSTDDVCRFGLLPPGDPGRQVLVVDDQVNALTPLPISKIEDHHLTITTAVDLTKPGERDAGIETSADGIGFADYLLRALTQSVGPHQVLPLLAGHFFPTSGTFIPKEQHGTAVDDLKSAFGWKAVGTWDGLVSRLPQSTTELFRLPAWIPQEWRVAALPRSNPLHLNEGYPMEIVQSWHVHLPPGASGLKLPEAQSDPGPQLKWTLTWSANSATDVTAKLTLDLTDADLDQTQTGGFQASCHHLEETLQDGLTYQLP